MITHVEAERFLHMFGIEDEIVSVECLQESEYTAGFRYIDKIITTDRTWVCRISKESQYSVFLVEMQSRFAMLLRKNGIITAKKLQCNHAYCIETPFRNTLVQITMEECLGKDFSDLTVNTFQQFGTLLGKMHFISEYYSAKIGKSYIAEAIYSHKAVFSAVLAKAVVPFPKLKELETIEHIHDQLISELSQVWNILPFGAVHGDLGLYNNLLETDFGLGVIDFNLAGDEVYLADALSSFYASIHKYSWHSKMQKVDRKKALADFLAGYCKERIFTSFEQNQFSKIAALFDGLFFCKATVEMWNDGYCDAALARMPEALFYFNPETHSCAV